MGPRVLMLYLLDGIAPLDSRKSVSTDNRAGTTGAQSIERTIGGFWVRYRKQKLFVPDSRVEAAVVEDAEPPEETEPAGERVPPPPSEPPAPSLHELGAAGAKAARVDAAEKRRLQKTTGSNE